MKIFYLPDLGEGLAEAEIREWYVKVGDHVKVDQPLVSMETAKAVVDVPSPYDGEIATLHGKVNDIIKTNAPLVTFKINEATHDETKKSAGSVVGSLEESSHKWDEGDVVIGTQQAKTKSIKAMPAARVLASQMNVDLSHIIPSGPQGLITPDDVKKFLQQASSHTHHGKTEVLHGVRRTMAIAMRESHHDIVPVTIIDDADITDLPKDCDITVHLIKAIIAGVMVEPSLNAWFDGRKMERKLFTEINLGLAIDTEEGLFVPVIKQAESYTEAKLREIIDQYKKTVRHRTISQKDMQGATITLSNFGSIAGCYATPIIVPPTVAILGCGRYRQVVLPRQGQIVIGRIIPLSLTFDHRAVTGGEATRFLAAVIKHLEKK